MSGGLRYYMHDAASSFRFKLAGSLVGEDVAELGQCWSTASSALGSRPFLVDIDELCEVDEYGRELLRQWHEQGAHFLARSAAARLLAETITGSPVPAVTPAHAPLPGWLSFRGAVLVSTVLLSLLLPAPVWAAPAPLPKSVLERYAAALEQSSQSLDCRAVALEIDASLPKLAQRGRLQAIRQWVRPGRSEYQAMRIEGDRTVKQQVIARYLSAQAQADALPSSAVAISAANYKFRYVGAIGSAESPTYVFQITPRRKRAGLIQGELWIDGASGLAVRKTGRLVKTPSVFVRRIEVVQDIDILDGAPHLRITHLEIDTRLVGRAELTIRERYCGPIAGETTQGGLSDDELACSTAP